MLNVKLAFRNANGCRKAIRTVAATTPLEVQTPTTLQPEPHPIPDTSGRSYRPSNVRRLPAGSPFDQPSASRQTHNRQEKPNVVVLGLRYHHGLASLKRRPNTHVRQNRAGSVPPSTMPRTTCHAQIKAPKASKSVGAFPPTISKPKPRMLPQGGASPKNPRVF